MGELWKAIDVAKVCIDYGIDAFVETGTGDGTSTRFVEKVMPGLDIHTVEFMPAIFASTKKAFEEAGSKIGFHLGSSKDVLREIIPKLSGNVLYWLDAHFPGADYGLAKYDTYEDNSLRIPLEVELSTICELRDVSHDVIVIDDLRIYEDGPFEKDNWEDRSRFGGSGIEFVYDLLGVTHEIEKKYLQQGFIIGWPKLN